MPSGLLRFLLADPARFSDDALERTYIAGSDQIPWLARYRIIDGLLVIEPSIADSARLHAPWTVEGFGEVMLCTATLMQREKPYHLGVELARGKINQVRNQLAEWQNAGLVVTPAVQEAVERAMHRFAQAATVQHDAAAAAQRADEALEAALQAADALTGSYTEQALAVRHRQASKLPALLGVRLDGDAPQGEVGAGVGTAFNAAAISLTWKRIEQTEGDHSWQACDKQIDWCRARGLQICGGPLLRLDERGLPDWLFLWEEDFEGLMAFASEYVATVVQRLKGRMNLWEAAARVNVGHVLSLSDEQKLRLAIRAVEVVRRIDPETPVIIRFDQPWGEYLRRVDADRLPVHFADDLVRAGVPLGGVGLDINVSYGPGGTFARDRLEYSRLIDLWSYLGVPLYLFLTVPSSQEVDPEALVQSAPYASVPGGWTPEHHARWISRYVPLLLAKPAVHGVFFKQLSDAAPHDYAHGGLFDAGGKAKPGVAAIAALRKAHLM